MILKADQLYTSASAPITNGMIRLDKQGEILEVGTNLSAEPSEVNHFKGALCPGFINTHCHLELSHMKGKVSQKSRLAGFVQELQQKRAASEEEIQQAIESADKEMYKNGIVAVGDISNGTSTFEVKQKSNINYHSFIELFGFDPTQAEKTFERGAEIEKHAAKLNLSASIVPHSPYSVSSKLMEMISRHAIGEVLSIHNQETAAENELFRSGSGEIKDMLEKFGLDISTFELSPHNSLPTYLKRLPQDSPLLLVHNTFTEGEDIALAKAIHDKLYWCFCPQANWYIEGRLPNFHQFINEKLKCTLGTDSLASNHSLSILEEMKLIQHHFPEIELNTLINWGCKNGAEFLSLDQLGTFEVGKKPGVNWIKNLENGRLTLESDVEKVV